MHFSRFASVRFAVRMCLVLIVITNLTIKTTAIADEPEILSFLSSGEQHPFGAFHLATIPQSGALVERGASLGQGLQHWPIRFGVLSTWSSDINYRKDLFEVDQETVQNSVYVCWPFSPHWNLDLLLPILTRTSGALDKPIRDWHGFFGFPQGARKVVEDNSYSFRAQTTDDETFQGPAQGTGLGVSRLAVRRALFPEAAAFESPMALTLLFAGGLPASSEDYGQQSLDLQLGIIGNIMPKFSDMDFGSVDVGIFATRYLDTTIKGEGSGELQYFPEHYSGFIYITSPEIFSAKFFLGTLLNSPQVSNIPTFDVATAYFDLGARLRLGDHIISLSFRENTPHSPWTTDVSFMLQWETKLVYP